MNFEKENCPLCGIKLIETKINKITNYDCPMSCVKHNVLDMTSKDQSNRTSHYSVTVTSTMTEIQRVYCLPYSIDTFGDKSRIYKLTDGAYDSLRWSLIKEVGVIITLSEEKMREKIKTILLFL